MSATWDPQQYLRFADERARPFSDLVARIGIDSPSRVVDLGCGPGKTTALLADRWPHAEVVGIDSSAEMIATTAELTRPGRLEFRPGDASTWRPDRPVDVIVCNAILHWVPGHIGLLPRLVDALSPGGWLAFAVPGNFDRPSHVLLRELARSDRWRDLLAGPVDAGPASHEPEEYLEALLDIPRAATVEVWETTYFHVLVGPDPVLDWIKGTTLRPLLEALRARGSQHRPGDEQEFLDSYAAALRAAYPKDRAGRTIFPFRRIFGVFRAG